jgi:hypothetical protein
MGRRKTAGCDGGPPSPSRCRWAETLETRRAFLKTLAGGLLAAPLAAEAQPARSVWRLGLLAPGLSQDTSRSSVLIQTLQELGFSGVPGQRTFPSSRPPSSSWSSISRPPRPSA